EIAKALVHESRVLILDEPSAVLGRHDLRLLFGVLAALKAHGTTIVYISHRLEEVFEIADRVTVLRDGRRVGTRPVQELTVVGLAQMMTGRSLEELWPVRQHRVGPGGSQDPGAPAEPALGGEHLAHQPWPLHRGGFLAPRPGSPGGPGPGASPEHPGGGTRAAGQVSERRKSAEGGFGQVA